MDEHKLAYKYPFNAADILSGENTYLLDKFFEDSNSPDDDKYEELDDYEADKPKEDNEEKGNENENEEKGNEDDKDILDQMDEVVEKIQKLEIVADNEKEGDREKEVKNLNCGTEEELKIEEIKISESNVDFEEKIENETKDSNDCDVIMNLSEIAYSTPVTEDKKERDNDDNEEMVNQEDNQKDDQNKNEKVI